MTEQLPASSEGDTPDTREYRVSHLMDDLADTFSERGMVQDVAPLDRGGIKPRVENRAKFAVRSVEGAGEHRPEVDRVLETDGYTYTVGSDPGEYIVLGRAIADLRELRKGDFIHVNKRRGPFKVYRVMDHAPEVVQRSDPAVTVELSNVDTDTDWLLVHWNGDAFPWAYCKTKDQHAKGGYRHRKVEQAHRLGRLGPFRLYAPSHDLISEGYQADLHERLRFVDDHMWRLESAHPSDMTRAMDLLAKPPADAFSPEDADTIRKVCQASADAHERQADAVHIEDNADRADAQENQQAAGKLENYAKAFNLANMDAIADTEDARIHICEDCGTAYTNRFKYPTHRRECDAGQIGNSEDET